MNEIKQKNNIFDSIYFDLDSTLVDIEGLDELAGFYSKKDKVANLTSKSMSGEVKLEDVFSLKLAIIRPKKSDFDKLGKLYIKHVTEDAKEVIAALHFLGKSVSIMSGNFYPAVRYVSQYLGVDEQFVFANQIIFDEKGNYLTFDRRGPLSIAGGKRSLMLILKRENVRVAFIGDGLTDAETRPPVDLFICYGGVIVRPNVVKYADVFIKCRSLSAIFPTLLVNDEVNKLQKSKFASLIKKGEELKNQGLIVDKKN